MSRCEVHFKDENQERASIAKVCKCGHIDYFVYDIPISYHKWLITPARNKRRRIISKYKAKIKKVGGFIYENGRAVAPDNRWMFDGEMHPDSIGGQIDTTGKQWWGGYDIEELLSISQDTYDYGLLKLSTLKNESKYPITVKCMNGTVTLSTPEDTATVKSVGDRLFLLEAKLNYIK